MAFAAWLLRYRRVSLRREPAPVIAGIGLMGAAIVADSCEHPLGGLFVETLHRFEDGARLLVSLFWSEGLMIHGLRVVESGRESREASDRDPSAA